MPLLRRQKLFAEIDDHFKQAARGICKDAVARSSAQCTEIVFEKGEPSKWMIFVEEGSLRYTSGAGLKHQLTKLLHDGPQRDRSNLFLRRKKKKSSKFDSFQGTDLTHGDWVSEAALWVDWRHAGSLIALVDSTLLTIENDAFAHTLEQQPEVYHFAAVYAWYFQQALVEEKTATDVLDLNLDLMDRLEEGPPYHWRHVEEDSLPRYRSRGDTGATSASTLSELVVRGLESPRQLQFFTDGGQGSTVLSSNLDTMSVELPQKERASSDQNDSANECILTI